MDSSLTEIMKTPKKNFKETFTQIKLNTYDINKVVNTITH